ncbi:MAG: hypothetical protein RL701_2858 [Pseudomonadota bacterium]|jgi:hypothetical protein
MTKIDVNPDALASKTFVITVIGALLYVTVVFSFVIGGNREIGEALKLEAAQAAQGK